MAEAPLPENKFLSPQPPRHGSTFGIVIIVLLTLILGAYFGLVRLEERRWQRQQIPYIPDGTTTASVINRPFSQ